MTAAYTLVDLSELDEKTKNRLLEDANAGGGQYGVRVVEEVVNGGARAPIYGYYRDGPDADRWAKAKKDLGISADDVDDSEVVPAQPDINDPRREAALREAAAISAMNEAERLRNNAARSVAEVTGEDEEGADRVASDTTGTAADNTHTANIVDDTLARDATNEAATAEPNTAKPTQESTLNTADKDTDTDNDPTSTPRRRQTNRAPR